MSGIDFTSFMWVSCPIVAFAPERPSLFGWKGSLPMRTYPPVGASVALLGTLLALSRKFHRPYATPSQAKLLELQKRFYGLDYCRASENNYLNALQARGFIDRIRRIRSLGPKGMRFDTTLYTLSKEAYRFLYRFGSSMSRAGVKVFAALNQSLRPSPSEKCPVDSSGLPSRDDDLLPRIRDFIKSIS